jgi:hypothetical protein
MDPMNQGKAVSGTVPNLSNRLRSVYKQLGHERTSTHDRKTLSESLLYTILIGEELEWLRDFNM